MRALSVTDYHKMELVDIDIPEPGDDEVRVQVAYCGICGSDVPRYFEGGVHSYPQVLGHEFSGVVDKVGKNVKNVKKGDRVAVAPLVPCGECDMCQRGEPAMCTQYSFIGSRQQGALADYVVAPSRNCLPVPDNVSLKEAALLEPLTVALHGVERARVHAGERVLVLGCGTIGLMAIKSLRARGVGEIIVSDLNPRKLELAKKSGADTVINASEVNIVDYFKEHERPTLTYETAGSAITQRQAVEVTAKKGQIAYIGTCTREVKFPPETFELIMRGELEITGSWMSYSAPFPGYEWTTGLRYMADGAINAEELVTGPYPLEDIAKPFDKMVEKDTDAVKVLYAVNEEIDYE